MEILEKIQAYDDYYPLSSKSGSDAIGSQVGLRDLTACTQKRSFNAGYDE